MDEVASDARASDNFLMTLLGIFAIAALVLAAVGVYGVAAQAARFRTREIGIRMALGAQRANVAWMVLKETLQLVALGALIGVPLAIGASRFVSSQLFGIVPTDPSTMAIAFLILSAISALAGYLPARRASSVNPIAALRHE